MWTEEPGCRFFCSGGLGDGVCGLWSLVCVAVVGMWVLVGGLLVKCGDGSGSRSGRQRILLLHFSRENRREMVLRREIKTSCGEK